MCDFSIEYPKSKNDMVGQLRAAIESQTDGVFNGDVSSGEFSFSARGFELAGGYIISDDLVQVRIAKSRGYFPVERLKLRLENIWSRLNQIYRRTNKWNCKKNFCLR